MKALDGTSRRRGAALLLVVCAIALFAPFAPLCAREKSEPGPRRVLIIRHAEKPAGDDSSVHLSPEGRERAKELHLLFEASAGRPDPLPAPDFIFAAKNSKHSHRSLETVTPLASKLKLTVNTAYSDDDFAKLAEEILTNRRYAGKTVLICWHHTLAPELANRLKAKKAPDHWGGSVFDRVWQITYGSDGKATFDSFRQRLPSEALEK